MDQAYQKFKAELDGLPWVVEATFPPPLANPRSRNCLRCAWDDEENFSSRQACQKAAEIEWKSAYQILADAFRGYTVPDSAKGLLTDFKAKLTPTLAFLRTALSGYRTPATAEVVDALLKHLDTTAIIEAMTQVHTRLRENYPCPKADGYWHLIQIDVNDPGEFDDNLALKALAKAFCRYGYNCYPAIQKAQEDMNHLLDFFYADFRAQAHIIIRTQIIDPILAELPTLRALLEPDTAHE